MNTNLRLILLASITAPIVSMGQTPPPQNVVPPGATGVDATVAAAPVPLEGFLLINGRMYKVHNGFATVVVGNGTVRGTDGRPVTLVPGQMFTADGRFIPIPAGITGLPPGINVGPTIAPGTAPANPGTTPGTNANPGTSPGTGTLPGSSPGTGAAPGASPGTGAAPGASPGTGTIPGNTPRPGPAPAAPATGGARPAR